MSDEAWEDAVIYEQMERERNVNAMTKQHYEDLVHEFTEKMRAIERQRWRPPKFDDTAAADEWLDGRAT